MRLYEKYRPAHLADVRGQTKAVAQCERLIKAGLGSRAVWVSGASGTGKTTLAWILARSLADDFAIEEVDASEITPSRLKELEQTMCLAGWGRGGRAYIVNEAHHLKPSAVTQLLVLLERLPKHVCIIFTCTRAGFLEFEEGHLDAGPLLSRCLQVSLTNQGLADPFAAYAMEIATKESLGGKPLEAFKKAAQNCKNNMRALLQLVESGEFLAA